MDNSNKSFAERHPRINLLLSIILLLCMAAVAVKILILLFQLIGNAILTFISFLKMTVNTTDKVIIVALITGGVSIIGVVISSIVAKVVEYRFNVKKYLYDKREAPYEQFIDMVYTIMEDTKKTEEDKMTEIDMIKMFSKFSKGLTLWSSNRVAKKWIKYRKSSKLGDPKSLFLLEDIIYEMRRDVGLRKMKKGVILSFFINDIERVLKKENKDG